MTKGNVLCLNSSIKDAVNPENKRYRKKGHWWQIAVTLRFCVSRVIAVDLKGFGDSDKPTWRRSYRLEKLISELRELITSLGVSSCILVGHDIGALLGWYLVHQHPDLVEKFVAVACPHPNVYWSDLPNSSTFNTRLAKRSVYFVKSSPWYTLLQS